MSARTIEIEGFVYEVDFGLGDNPHYTILRGPNSGDRNYTLVGPCRFTYTLPEGYSAKAAQIARLQQQREEAARNFAETLRAIDQRLAELQAIEYAPPEDA